MFKFKDFIATQEWIFAKTYAKTAPHEYIVRSEKNEEDFVKAVKFIRSHGFKAKFWRKERIYYFVDGRFYWTMGSPISKTIIINRCDSEKYELFMSLRKDGNDLQGK